MSLGLDYPAPVIAYFLIIGGIFCIAVFISTVFAFIFFVVHAFIKNAIARLIVTQIAEIAAMPFYMQIFAHIGSNDVLFYFGAHDFFTANFLFRLFNILALGYWVRKHIDDVFLSDNKNPKTEVFGRVLSLVVLILWQISFLLGFEFFIIFPTG
ncbi:MAG: flavodoxin family protein [Defluviitaleaceae bacterium]|nr:flavodoxin family protein [Defluviitaleaceae bacterium]